MKTCCLFFFLDSDSKSFPESSGGNNGDRNCAQQQLTGKPSKFVKENSELKLGPLG